MSAPAGSTGSRARSAPRCNAAAMQRRRRARSGYINEVCATIHRHGARYADLDAGSLTEAVASLRGELVTKEHTLRTEGTGHGACGLRGACSG